MRACRLFLPVLFLLVTATAAVAQVEYPRLSPRATVEQQVGLAEVTIRYNRPSMRGRTIWGELVPYGQVWRTGANEATTIEISDDVTVNGQKLAKGIYSIHTIPGPEEWTLIFNSVAQQWGSYTYDAAKDVVRLQVRPIASAHVHELFTVAFPHVTEDSAEVHLAWDRLMVPFNIEVATEAKVLASIRSQLGWGPLYQAANWAFQNEVEGADTMQWVDQSIALRETWQNLQLKARLLAAAGNRREAVTFGERALRLGAAAQNPPDMSALQREIAEWKR
ncbi:MAG TPA: DUF2911 domain-containing protein [Thermoanaerobaculia bacterium]|nr:DUF2911 domain-containing protein [Thermoanaerobaculia bacterium]